MLDLIRDDDDLGKIYVGMDLLNLSNVTMRPNSNSNKYGDFINGYGDSLWFGGKTVGNEIIYGIFDASGYESIAWFKTDVGVSLPQNQPASMASPFVVTSRAALAEPAAQGTFLGMTFASALNQVVGTPVAENLSGAAGRDYVQGFDGFDNLNGLFGDDVIDGGFGNDVIHGGAGADDMIGEDGDDQIFGDDGDDKLVGGYGNDLLIGGLGADVIDGYYDVDTASYGTSVLGVTVNLDLGSSASQISLGDASGDILRDIDNLIGSAFSDTLTGDANSNQLDGGAGDDTLLGGNGSDTYLVDLAFDVVTDTGAATDVDTVKSMLTEYTLGADLENLTFMGGLSIGGVYAGIGNASNNILTGDDLSQELFGLAGNDTIYGLDGNDYIDGGTGNDRMEGGLGDDKYLIDSSGDMVVEYAGGGTYDRVQLVGGVSWTLAAEFENLAMDSWGTMAANGTGNSLDNGLFGNAGANTLKGLSGNDLLDGRGGTDILIGGIGDDTYRYRGATTTITELVGEGNDTVLSEVVITALLTNVENLTLLNSQTNPNFNGTGNTVANVMIGNDGNNTLSGLAGNDRIEGGWGKDTLTGGTGSDTFVFSKSSSGITATTLDVISDYAKGALGVGDKIDYTVALARGGSATVASATQASINQTTGVATFASGQGTTLTDAISDVYTRLNAVNNADGRFAFFKVNAAGNYYAFISDGVAGLSSNDTVIQMTGVTAITALNLTSGDLTIA